MQVYFCAALDGVHCRPGACTCDAWIASASAPPKRKKAGKSTKKKAADDAVAFPPPVQVAALLDALDGGQPGPVSDPRRPAWNDFPVYAWRSPLGVEIGFSTLCAAVRSALAVADEPATIATADGGWRRAIGLFGFDDGLRQVRVRPRDKMPWAEFAELRDISLDIISDRRQPLLARLAEVAGIASEVVDNRGLPAELPALSARSFLAWRGFLESRVASANAKKLHAFYKLAAPLFQRDLSLSKSQGKRLSDALADDWRDHMLRRVTPRERWIADALEAYFCARFFALPIQRDVSLARGWAEIYEGFAVGLRYLAALAEVTDSDATPAQAVAAMALGEHYVVHAGDKLPAFTLPPASHGPAPRMADVDMTFASIC